MVDEQKKLQEVVLTRLLRLNATIQGIISGLVAGLGIFIATNWLVLKGGDVVGPHLSLLGEFFIGYKVTFAGSLIGFAYACVIGFVAGYGVTAMYNYLVEIKERKRAPRA